MFLDATKARVKVLGRIIRKGRNAAGERVTRDEIRIASEELRAHLAVLSAARKAA